MALVISCVLYLCSLLIMVLLGPIPTLRALRPFSKCLIHSSHFWVLSAGVLITCIYARSCAGQISFFFFCNEKLFVYSPSGCATISWCCCNTQDWHRHKDHNPHWLESWNQRLPPLSFSPPISTLLMLLLNLPCLSSFLHTRDCLCLSVFILCPVFTFLG